MTGEYVTVIPEGEGCPDGMYPMDSNSENECWDLEELIGMCEAASDSLNFPISFYFTPEDDLLDGEKPKFEVVFLMPRKYGKTWSYATKRYDRAEAEAWLSRWLPTQVHQWYGLRIRPDERGD